MSKENKANQIEKIIEFLGPIADSITFIESDLPRISNVLGIFNKLEDSFLKLIPDFQNERISENTLMAILSNRKNFCVSKIHLAATLLDQFVETIYQISNCHGGVGSLQYKGSFFWKRVFMEMLLKNPINYMVERFTFYLLYPALFS